MLAITIVVNVVGNVVDSNAHLLTHTHITRCDPESQADAREVVQEAVFERLGAHRFDESRSFFATVAAYGSRTPRPCRRSVCYLILVAGTACVQLSADPLVSAC